MSALPAPSPYFGHWLSCQEFATSRRNESFEQGGLVYEEEVELRYGLRGVRVGMASHPGPPRRHFSRPIARMHPN